jgi:hypothetical protein
MTIRTRLFILPLLLLFVGATAAMAQSAQKEEWKRQKEAHKRQEEHYREMRKADEEYNREMMKADEEYYREMLKDDREAYKEYLKERREAMKEGRPLPPPPGYGPYDDEYYEEDGYEYDDEHYGNDDDGYGQSRRRPTGNDDDAGVIVEGEVKIKGRKRLPMHRARGN